MFTKFSFLGAIIAVMVEIDKKFILKELKLLIVGGFDQGLVDRMRYIGFEDMEYIVDPAEAIEYARLNLVKMIVCHLKMPGMGGAEFIKNIRLDSKSVNRFSHILVLAEASELVAEEVSAARDAGATEFIITPFEIIPTREKILYIIENPRNFIISRQFMGPDRRRKKIEVINKRRKDE